MGLRTGQSHRAHLHSTPSATRGKSNVLSVYLRGTWGLAYIRSERASTRERPAADQPAPEDPPSCLPVLLLLLLVGLALAVTDVVAVALLDVDIEQSGPFLALVLGGSRSSKEPSALRTYNDACVRFALWACESTTCRSPYVWHHRSVCAAVAMVITGATTASTVWSRVRILPLGTPRGNVLILVVLIPIRLRTSTYESW